MKAKNYLLKKVEIVLSISILLLFNSEIYSQTILLNQTGDGGFETGNTFALNGWTVVNGTETNQWVLGNDAGGQTGNRCAYISNDSATYNYDGTVGSVVHFYKDITFPAGQTDIELTFDVKGVATFDYGMKIWLLPTSTTPVAGAQISSGTQLGSPIYSKIGNNFLRMGTLIDGANAGTTKRVVFSWYNNSGGSIQNTSVAIENIQIISRTTTAMSGTYTIDNTSTTSGTNFNNFVDAVLKLNKSGVSGPVIFNVAAGQNFHTFLPVITATGTASKTITFQKSGVGANPAIKFGFPYNSSNSAVEVDGGDYFTFDGIDISFSDEAYMLSLNDQYCYTFYLNGLSGNGVQYNTIKNCSLTKNIKAGGFAICVRSSSASTAASASSFNKIQNVDISNCIFGIYFIGVDGTYRQKNNEVSNCKIHNLVATNSGSSTQWAVGIRMNYVEDISIFSNEFYDFYCTPIGTFGIWQDYGYGTTNIYNNSFHGFESHSVTSSTSCTYGLYLNVVSGHRTNVYNNMFYDFTLSAPQSSYSEPNSIICVNRISGLTGTVNMYNNSILADDYNMNNNTCINLINGTLNLKNNVLSNKTSIDATKKRYCLIKGSGGTLNASDYNDFDIDATQTGSYLIANGTTDYSTLAAWQTATAKDIHSVSSNPEFFSYSNLHSNSPNINKMGIPVKVALGDAMDLTTDFDGDTRDVSTPDIGADEFSLATTCTLPLTPLNGATNVVSTTSLTWQSAANATNYKLYFGTDNPPTNIVNGALQVDTNYIPASPLSGSTTYYWKVVPTSSEGDATGCATWSFITQAPAPSLSIVSALTAFEDVCAGSTSAYRSFTIVGANLTSNITVNALSGFNYSTTSGGAYTSTLTLSPISGNLNQIIYVKFSPASASQYSGNIDLTGGGLTSPISQAASGTGLPLMSGTYTVGIGGDFTTLTSAVAAYNSSKCISGNIIFSLIDANYSSGETFPIRIYQNNYAGTYTLTIKPAAGVNSLISGSADYGAVIELIRADYVTIDGSNNGTNSRNLSITNTSLLTPSVITLANDTSEFGATNNTIKNCIIYGNLNSTTSFGISIGSIAPGSAGSNNDNNTIVNNWFYKVRTAINAIGLSSTNPGRMDNLTITDNLIGSNNSSNYVGFCGIFLGYANNINISGNEIFNIIYNTQGHNSGIELDVQVTSVTISKNIIHDIISTNINQGGGRGISLNTQNNTSNITISNNYIFNISGVGSTSLYTGSPAGMYIVNTGGLNIYYNTVRLSTFVNGKTSAIYTGAIIFDGTNIANIDVRNNIFENEYDNINSSSDKNYAIYSKSPASSFTHIDNNSYYVSGGQGIIAYYVNADITTFAGLQSSFGQNTNSINLKAPFISNANLHLNTVGANISSFNAAGTPIALITSDYDGDARHATDPDLGADEISLEVSCTNPISPVNGASGIAETSGLSWDSTSLATGYKLYFGTNTPPTNLENGTLLTDTTYIPSSNLDPSTTYYWKVVPTGYDGDATGCATWSFTTQAAQPTLSITSPLSSFGSQCVGSTSTSRSFTINGLNLTGSVTVNALAGFAYCLTSGGTYTSTLTLNPVSGSISNQTIYVKFSPVSASSYSGNIDLTGGGLSVTVGQAASGTGVAQMNGTYTVGPGGNYTTLTQAINAYNNALCISSNIVFSLTAASYSAGETFPLTISQNSNAGTYTLTIKPAPSNTVTISGSVDGDAVLKLNGADYIIVDGSNSGGTDRSMTILNSSTTNPISVSVVSLGSNSGATNNTIKNCVIYTGTRGATSYGIFAGGNILGSAGADNDNLTIQNNLIYKVYKGIFAKGTAATNPGRIDNLVINGNTLGHSTAAQQIAVYGMELSYINNLTVNQNTIYNLNYSTPSPNSNVIGIYLYLGVSNAVVSGNNINNISYTGTGSYCGRGLAINTGISSSNITVYNNIIHSIFGYGQGTTVGNASMWIDGTSTGGISIYYNTFALSGSELGGSGMISAAIGINNSNISNINLRNNLFYNTYDNTNSNNNDKNYAIYSAAASSAFTGIDYNDYYVSGGQGILGYIGSDRTTLATLQAGFGSNTHSLNANPGFTSGTNYHISNYALNNAGVSITGITTDYEGTSRGAIPDIGAYVITGTPQVTTSETTLKKSEASTLNGSIDPRNEGTFTMSFDWGLTTAYGNNLAWTNPTASGATLATESKELTGLTHNTTYHYRVKAVGPSGTTYGADQSFTTYLQPTVHTSSMGVNPGSGQITIEWSNGNGVARLVKVNNQNSFTFPQDRVDYSSQANITWQNTGEQVVYDGTSDNITINLGASGTLTDENIWYAVFEYKVYSEAKANVKIYDKGWVGNEAGDQGWLPIELVNFDANFDGAQVNLTWQTASELNNNYFVIEKSKDLEDFSLLAMVDGAGNSSSLISYDVTDQHPYSGTSYYRLSQTDFDGKTTIFKPVPICITQVRESSLELVKSNSGIEIDLYSTEAGPGFLQIIDVSGKVLHEEQILVSEGENNFETNIGVLKGGVYMVSVNLNSTKLVSKLLIY